MADRELTMKLGMELKGGGDEALRRIGRTALDARRDTDSLTAAFQDGLKKSVEASRALEEQLKKTFGTGSRELDALNAKLGKFDKQFRDVAKKGLGGSLAGVAPDRLNVRLKEGQVGSVGQAFQRVAGMGGQFGGGLLGMAGFGGMLSGATAALTAFTVAVKAAAAANELHYKSLEYNPNSGTVEENSVTRMRERDRTLRASSVWNLWGAISAPQEAQLKGAGFAATRENYQRYLEHGLTSQGGLPGGRRLLADQTRWGRFKEWLTPKSALEKAQKERASNMSYEQFQQMFGASDKNKELREFQARQELSFAPREASAQAAALRALGGLRMDYARTSAETHATLGMRESSYGITHAAGQARGAALTAIGQNPLYKRETQIEDVNRQIGMREALLRIGAQGHYRQQTIAVQLAEAQQQAGHHRQNYGTAQKAEAAAKASVETARKEQLGGEEIDRRAQLALAATERRKQAEDSLLEAQRQSLALRKQGEREILQTQEQQHAVLQQNLDAVTKQLEQEKRSKMQTQERLGLLNPMQHRAILGVANKLQKGGPITQREISFMQQHGDIFGNALQKIGSARGGGLMAALRQMPVLGLDQREKSLAEQKVKLEQEIKATVVLDAGSVTDRLVKAVRPEIENLMAQTEAQLRQEMERIAYQRWAHQRSLFPGAS
jgi:hypothetical protein